MERGRFRIAASRGAFPALAAAAAILLPACAPPAPTTSPSADVEPVVRAFYDALGALDLDAVDTLVTRDFEIVDGGRRLDARGFRRFVTDLAADGLAFDFELSDWNTRIEGSVAWTTLTSVNRAAGGTFHESMVLRWSDAGWRIDRFHSAAAR